jgi:hypothetical protein
MTLKQFERKFAQKVKRERSRWDIGRGFGSLRTVSNHPRYLGHCPLTYMVQDQSMTVGTCAERLGLRLSTARRIADAADHGDSLDGLRTRLLRAAGVTA